MYKKKISTIAIITILTLSTIIAAIPVAFALPIAVPTLTPPGPGPVGTMITVSGTDATPFGLVEVYWDTLATKLGEGYANNLGVYSIMFIFIPEDVVGPHEVIVYDVLSSTINSETFTIESEIELSTEKGLPGDSITVTGTGFGDELEVGIYLGTITPVAAEPVALAGTPVTGTFANPAVVIGTVSIDVDVTVDGEVNGVPVTGTDVVTVTDDGEGNLDGETLDVIVDDGVVVESGEVDVTITGSINYATGVITLTATGIDSAGGTGEVTDIVVTIETPCAADYDYAEYILTPAAGVTTSDAGSFEAVIMVPVTIAEVAYGDYTVTALDTDANTATATLAVNYYITLTPASGPTGITTTIAGRIKADTAFELRFNTVPIATGTSGTDGSFSDTYVIPSVLSTGPYDVDVVWEVVESRTEIFTVTAPPQVVYAPLQGVAGTVVTISTVAGFPFSSGANISLYIGTTLVNSTQMDDRFGPTGSFPGPNPGEFFNLKFTVPTLTPGPYALKVVDEFGASTAAIYSFTVLPTPVTTVALNGASYYQGDALSFAISTTETGLGTITVTIRDPSGATWWTANTWALTGTVMKRVVYQDQLFNNNPAVLPADAPLGSWNWTATYTPASTGIMTKATGLFTVSAPPTMQTVLTKIDEMEATITAVVTSSEGDLTALINTKTGPITTKLDAISPKLQAIEDTAVIIATMLGEVQVDIAALNMSVLDADITAIKGDVATIKTNIGTVNAAVSALDAKVTDLSGDVATVSTTVATLEGKVTSIDGNVATIETDVGTIKADVSEVKDKPAVDMTPVWIAVVLSLIAAIAAIFAVVTIRQKIAG